MNGGEPVAPDRGRLAAAHGAETAPEFGAEGVVALIEETARVEKRAVETGRVRVRTVTETTEQLLRESLCSEAVAVTRVPVGRTLGEGEAPPQVRTEDGVTIIPVFEEILVVEKRLVLVEEVYFRQTTASEDVAVPVTLRKQRAVTERVSSDGRTVEETPTQEGPTP